MANQIYTSFAFSIHKAGSTLMHEMIRDVCAARNIPAISLPDQFFNQGILDHEWAYDPKVLKDIYVCFLNSIFLLTCLQLKLGIWKTSITYSLSSACRSVLS